MEGDKGVQMFMKKQKFVKDGIKPTQSLEKAGSWPATAFEGSTILLVDDNEQVLKTLSRVLDKYFDNILVAPNSVHAKWLLSNTNVSHVVCDYNLGHDDPDGFNLVSSWRQQYKQIKKSKIYSGSSGLENSSPKHVDAVVDKSADVSVLLKALNV